MLIPVLIAVVAILSYFNKSTIAFVAPQEIDSPTTDVSLVSTNVMASELTQSSVVDTSPHTDTNTEFKDPQSTKTDSATAMSDVSKNAESQSVKTHTVQEEEPFDVPFYSQFADITSPRWQKVGCGIASLAMLIEFYKPGSVKVDTLLDEGISAHAYLDSAGWTYAGLIGISNKYGLGGTSHDIAKLTMKDAFSELKTAVSEGPVMVSVHYTFDPKNPIPHLVILNGIEGDRVYYNDPAEKSGNGSISISTFQNSWKKRYIEIRPLS